MEETLSQSYSSMHISTVTSPHRLHVCAGQHTHLNSPVSDSEGFTRKPPVRPYNSVTS